MEPVEFFKPKMVGGRFEGHAIPLELLRDLAVLEEMVVEVAKWRYLEDNPGRTRSPRGFSEGISLSLAAVGEGSAIATIVLSLVAMALPSPTAAREAPSRPSCSRWGSATCCRQRS